MKIQKGKAEQNKCQKRKAIFLSAIENFAKNGFHETSMAQIAGDAGVADGTIYLYYKNKHDLLVKVFDEMVYEKLEIIKKVIQNESNAINKLYLVFQYHIDLYTNNPSFVRFFVQEVRQSPDFYKRYPDFHPLQNYLNLLEELIIEAIKQGLIKNVNPQLTAKMIFGSIDFILSEWALNKEDISLNNIYKEVIDIFHNGLKLT